MFTLYKSYTSPLNASYEGMAEEALFTFSLLPEQLDFINNFFTNLYVGECEKAIAQNSPQDELLKMVLYRDTAPTWQTNYKCYITATDRTGNVLPWALIILASLVVLVYWLVVNPMLTQVTNLIYGPPGKQGLVGMIPWFVVGAGIFLIIRGQKWEVERATK